MARLPVSSSRGSRNVRNGPSPLQSRLASLLREARWIVFAALAVWLALVLASWNKTDPAWSQSVPGNIVHNRGGALGAYVADLLLFLFGYSAWLWVVLLGQRVLAGFYRLTAFFSPGEKPDELPRLHWEAGVGFFLRSEEHTSELQSRENLVCRLLLDKKT